MDSSGKPSIFILVVEDDPAHAEIIRRVLGAERLSFHVRIVSTLRECFEAIAELLPDLVLADINLPDGKAFDLLEKTREESKFPVLMMTSYGDEQMAVTVLKAGALDYVVKSQQAFIDLPHVISRALREWKHICERRQAEQELRRSHALTQLNLQRMKVLHNIDLAITGTVDLRRVVETILQHILQIAQIDAAVVYLPEQEGSIDMAIQIGAPSALFDPMVGDWRNGLVYRVFAQRRPVFLPDLRAVSPSLLPKGVDLAPFASSAMLPLVIGETVRGVLLVFSHSPVTYDDGWQDFLKSLSMQIAIALERSDMFCRMEIATAEIVAAYESTLEGWSRALELRERETAGHSQRVVAMTLELARRFGFSTEEQIHVRRGALLHDIGKMAVPDNLLLKPGPLTDEEWAIMRQHPIYAYRMLEKIPYLRRALDIPYCHHEKWDGSGYPQGLAGEKIPLAARLFTVVDVWDALSWNRPYKAAWRPEDIIRYLEEHSGKYFDPQVVKVFLDIVGAEK